MAGERVAQPSLACLQGGGVEGVKLAGVFIYIYMYVHVSLCVCIHLLG